jgi:hypothetical protein
VYPATQAHGRQSAATKDFLEEKAGQPETSIRWPDRF